MIKILSKYTKKLTSEREQMPNMSSFQIVAWKRGSIQKTRNNKRVKFSKNYCNFE